MISNPNGIACAMEHSDLAETPKFIWGIRRKEKYNLSEVALKAYSLKGKLLQSFCSYVSLRPQINLGVMHRKLRRSFFRV
jgi:hypothetical protein